MHYWSSEYSLLSLLLFRVTQLMAGQTFQEIKWFLRIQRIKFELHDFSDLQWQWDLFIEPNICKLDAPNPLECATLELIITIAWQLMNNYHLFKMQDTRDVKNRTIGSVYYKDRKDMMENLLKSEMGAEDYISDQNGNCREPFRCSLLYCSSLLYNSNYQ